MTTSARHAIAASLAVSVAIIVGFVLLVGVADARRGTPDGNGCRMARHCKVKPVRATPTPTPTVTIAPGCMEYGPECVIDLTGSWPTTGPVVIVQTFPCPMAPEPEPCDGPVTVTTTATP